MTAGERVLKRTGPRPYYPPAGTYGVVKTRGFLPWIIRRVTGGWADHAFIVVDDEGGIVEAEAGGIRAARIDEYAGHRVAINVADDMTVQQRRVVAAAALDMVGDPYNWAGLVDDGLEAFGRQWKWLASRAQGRHGLICSQAVAVCGHRAGLDWRCGRSQYYEVTPADLAGRLGMRAWPF